MIVLRGFPAADDTCARDAYRGGCVSIGNFDGVHRGHQSMLAALTRNARGANVPSVVFTFEPHPIALLRPQQTPPALVTTERKLELLAAQGVDCVLVYPTDQALLNLTPREFFDRVIRNELAATGLVEGPNFSFGHNRAGNTQTLAEFCREAGIGLEIVPPLVLEQRLVSSSEIRNLINSGDVAVAAQLLGSSYRLTGRVATGAARGRTIGFPTANLVDVPTVIPRDGVYAGRARQGERWIPAGINVGPNPTFGESQRKIEVHLIDFQGDLYGQSLDVEFLDRLRDTQPFGSVDALKTQLTRDIDRVRQVAGPPSSRD